MKKNTIIEQEIDDVLNKRKEWTRRIIAKCYPWASGYLLKTDSRKKKIDEYAHYLLNILPRTLDMSRRMILGETAADPTKMYQLFTNYEKIYHYTTLRGLQGIIENNCIWLNSSMYMNDSTENTYAHQLTSVLIDKFIDENRGHDHVVGVIKRVVGRLASNIRPCYIACFSSECDDLAMWRPYGNDGGFCIEFNLADDVRFDIGPNCFFYNMIYDNATQEKLIRYVLSCVSEMMFEDYSNCKLNDFRDILDDCYGNALTMALMSNYISLKHSAFSNEKEIRLRYHECSYCDLKKKFRIKGNVIVPYYEYSGHKKDKPDEKPEKLPISSIVIGPCECQDLIQTSLEDFLQGYGYPSGIVKMSTVPYRRL